MVIVVTWGIPILLFYIQEDKGYKKSPRFGYNRSLSRTLSQFFHNYKI
jgi:hypothetical protein